MIGITFSCQTLLHAATLGGGFVAQKSSAATKREPKAWFFEILVAWLRLV
jgi:hypothetical protein